MNNRKEISNEIQFTRIPTTQTTEKQTPNDIDILNDEDDEDDLNQLYSKHDDPFDYKFWGGVLGVLLLILIIILFILMYTRQVSTTNNNITTSLVSLNNTYSTDQHLILPELIISGNVTLLNGYLTVGDITLHDAPGVLTIEGNSFIQNNLTVGGQFGLTDMNGPNLFNYYAINDNAITFNLEPNIITYEVNRVSGNAFFLGNVQIVGTLFINNVAFTHGPPGPPGHCPTNCSDFDVPGTIDFAVSPLNILNKTLIIQLANASLDGYLSKEDWYKFNLKQNEITGFTGALLYFLNNVVTSDPNLVVYNNQIWDSRLNAIFRQGAWQVDGDSFNRNSDGLIFYGPNTLEQGPDSLNGGFVKIKTNEIGLAQLIHGQNNNNTFYYFQVNETYMTMVDNSNIVQFQVNRLNGNVYIKGQLSAQLNINNFNNGNSASSTTYWRGDGTWHTPTAGIPTPVEASSVLLSTGTPGVEVWSVATYPSSTIANQLLYSSSNDIITGLATNNNAVLVTDINGIPSLSTSLPNTVQVGIDSLNNGIGASSTTFWSGSNAWISPFPGSSSVQNKILQSSVTDGAVTWSTATYPADTVGNQLLYSSASNVVGGLPTAANGILVTNNIGVPSWSTSIQVTSFPSSSIPNQILVSTGTAKVVAWSNTTYPSNTVVNQLLYSNASNIVVGLPTVNNGILITNAAGVPSWSTTLQITSFPQSVVPNQIIVSTATSEVVTWSNATYPPNTIVNQLLYSSAPNIVAGLPTLDNAILITNSAGVPSWSTSVQVTSFPSSTTPDQIIVSTGTAGVVAWSTATYPPTTTVNQLLYSSASNDVAGLPTVNNGILTTNGAGVPAWSTTLQISSFPQSSVQNQILLSTATSEVVTWSNTTFPPNTTINQLLYSSANNVIAGLPTLDSAFLITNSEGVPLWTTTLEITSFPATTGQNLTLISTGIPGVLGWSNATYPPNTIINQLLYSNANNAVSGLPTADNGILVTNSAGVPSWSTSLQITTFPASVIPDQILMSTGTAGVVVWSTAIYPPSTTVNQLLYSSASNVVTGLSTLDNAILITDSAGVPSWSTSLQITTFPSSTIPDQILVATGTAGVVAWSTATYPPSTTVNQLLYSSASNIVAGLPTVNNAILITNGAGVPSWSSTLQITTFPQSSTPNQIIVSTSTDEVVAWSTATYPPTTTINQLLYSSATNTISGLPTLDNAILLTNGAGVPVWSANLPVNNLNSGTGADSLTFWNGLGIWESPFPSTSTANQILQSTTMNGVVTWSTAVYPQTTTINQLLYSSSNNVVSGVNTINNAGLITDGSGVPQWVAFTGSGAPVLANNPTLVNPILGNATATSLVLLMPLAVLQGGTGSNCSTGTGCVVLSISPTLVAPILGAASATSLTLSIPLAVLYGGTGLASTIINQLLYSSSANVISGLPTANSAILLTNSLGVPVWSLNLPVNNLNSGTGASSITFWSGSGTWAIPFPSTSTANQILQSTITNGVVTWSTATYPPTTTVNQLLYSSASNVVSGLSTANNGILVTNGAGVPSWSTTLQITTFPSSTTPDQILVATSTAGVVAWSTATYPPTTTINQLLYSSTSNVVAGLPTVNNGILVTNGAGVPSWSTTLQITSFPQSATPNQILVSTGTDEVVTWSTATYPPTTTVNQLLYSSSNNAVVGLPTVNNAALLTNGAGVPGWVAFTGSGAPVLANNPTFINPILGAATATSLTISTPLPVLSGGSGTNCSTGTGCVVLSNSPTLVNPILGAASASSLVLTTTPLTVTSGGTGLGSTTINQLLYSSAANTIAGLPTVNNAGLITTAAGVPEWVAFTGSGAPVLENNPTLINPILGAATATSLTLSTPLPVLSGGSGTNCSTGTGCAVLSKSPSLTTPYLDNATALSLTLTNPLAVHSGGSGTNCSTGTGCVVLANTPTITTANLVGDKTSTGALAGSIGEYLNATSSPVAYPTSGVVVNPISLTLTAGHWRIYGVTFFDQTGGTTWRYTFSGISTSTGVIPPPPNLGSYNTCAGINNIATITAACNTGNSKLTFSTTTTVYLVANNVFTSGTCDVWGFIAARRIL